MKKFKTIAYIILFVIIIVLSLSIYTNASKNNEESQKQKALSEIQFVESKFINLFNTINNIEYKNYTISTGDLSKETTEKSSSDESSQGASKQEASSGGGASGGSENSSSGGGGAGGGSSSGGGGASSESSSQQEQGDNKKFDLKSTGVLTNTEDINWDSIKTETENLYTSLPSITIDLYQLNINQQDMLSFNREYDTLTTYVKEEKKEETLAQLAKLYDYLPKFLKSSGQDEFYTNLIETKSNILKGYAKLDSNNWEEIAKDIQNAIQVYSNLLTKTDIEPRKQYSINKIYIMLNELQSATNQKDVTIFLIKYKNLLEEMNNM